MGPWVLKFMIVFSVILLQYVKTDVRSGDGGSLQGTEIIDANSRHKRSYGRSKFRTGKNRRHDPLENQLETRKPIEKRLPAEPWYYNTELSGRPLASSNQERGDNRKQYSRDSEPQDYRKQYSRESEPQDNRKQFSRESILPDNNQQQYPRQSEPQDNNQQKYPRQSEPQDNNQQKYPRQSEPQDNRKQHTRVLDPPGRC
ncbi:activating signal cointegrator 1 complex subunit 2 homolog isoform X24 [Mytilus edulis]|uniref:activating signal cointegrator 1 complex subunit 2 homolog isoform X23 n=1 Tax=Mytilus edulis TaxID=6550 RepID=UPI0039EF496A